MTATGRTDIGLVNQEPGEERSPIPIAYTQADGTYDVRIHDFENFTDWATESGVQIITGDFNRDGRTDIGLVKQESGWNTIPIAYPLNDGGFKVKNNSAPDFAAGVTISSAMIITGDFNGDGRTDVGLVNQNPGWDTITIAYTQADGTFTIKCNHAPGFTEWATEQGARIITGDFNSDGCTEIGLVNQRPGWNTIPIAYPQDNPQDNGTFPVNNNPAEGFASWATQPGVQIITGDFNGDGCTDIGLVNHEPGWNTVPIAYSSADGKFIITNNPVGDFSALAVNLGVNIITGDFNGDGCTDIGLLKSQLSYEDLAGHWAPDFYQDTDNSNYEADVLIKFNFDGDYNGRNNWENLDHCTLGRVALRAYVYYSVVETNNFYFIGYYTFHPQDWHELNPADRHENDLEGVLLAVRKNSDYGTLVCAVTEAHNDLINYIARGMDLTEGSDDIDGTLRLRDSHPLFFIEAKGHGVEYHYRGNAPGGDGIVYEYNKLIADSPTDCTGNWTHKYNYKLIALDNAKGDQGLWYRRNQIGNDNTFAKWGYFRGDNGLDNDAAQAPWSWDDGSDGETFSGDLICDPAHMIDCHLDGSGIAEMSYTYISNIYAIYKIEILAVRSEKNMDILNGKSDIFIHITTSHLSIGSEEFFEDPILDARAWKKNDAGLNQYYNFKYGGEDAESQRTYTEEVRTYYFSRGASPTLEIRLAVYDSDLTEVKFMGVIPLSGTVDFSNGVDLGDSSVKFRFTKLR